MEGINKLINDAAQIVKSAISSIHLYNKEYHTGKHVGLIVFSNLRPNFEKLNREMIHAASRNKKLVCILNIFQDAMLTLRDYTRAIHHQMNDETDDMQQQIKKSIKDVSLRFGVSLHTINVMKVKLDDKVMPVSDYSQAHEVALTKKVANYLKQGSMNKLVYAVRDYAILVEVVYCAEELIEYLMKVQNMQ